jgi:hypothetical protein
LPGTRADLFLVEGVRSVTMLENTTEVVNANGLPPHSFEAIVRGTETTILGMVAENARIAAQVWLSKPAGVRSFGTTTVVVQDASGVDRTVEFTRPTVLPAWLTFELDVDPDTFPADGAAQVAARVEALGAALLVVGGTVYLSRFYCAAFAVEGVRNVTAVRAGFAASPTGIVNLEVGLREIAEITTDRVVVIS